VFAEPESCPHIESKTGESSQKVSRKLTGVDVVFIASQLIPMIKSAKFQCIHDARHFFGAGGMDHCSALLTCSGGELQAQ
jgi:hypothetical protein